MAQSRYLTQLRLKLDKHFNDEELRSLCFDLGIQYDNLGGRRKVDNTRELAALMDRSGRISELAEQCSKLRPKVTWTVQARLFLSYKRYAENDEALAEFLHQYLTENGHLVFIDKTLRTGNSWLDEIDSQLRESDYLVVLLSKESADSEMVQSEIRRAYDYQKHQGHPHILPVRVAYTHMLPYSIDAFLNPLQYVVWHEHSDNERIGQEILAALEDDLPDKEPVQFESDTEEITVSEDGRYVTDSSEPSPPLSEFDPRLLDELVAPGGAVRLQDNFYVVRDADDQLKRQLTRRGSITTIRASRQTGKSSLLVRGIHYARQQDFRFVNLDMQRVDREHLGNPDAFLRYLAEFIARRLRLGSDVIETAWQGTLGPQDKLTYFMEDHALADPEERLILAIDEADRLLETDFYTDFFALIRSWHNSAAYDEIWENLSIVMVISTEPYLLIADANQSPFNVGLKTYLEDFTAEQVSDLNKRHGSPVSSERLPDFMALLGGHPYLTRKGLYTLVTEGLTWDEFMAEAPTDKGPFSDHLRRQLWLLKESPNLRASLKLVVNRGRCDDEAARFRLLRAGLIRASGDTCSCRNDLYKIYFRNKLD